MTRGRGHSLTTDDIAQLERLFRAGKRVVETVRMTGISKLTVCRHFKRFRENQCTKTTKTESTQ